MLYHLVRSTGSSGGLALGNGARQGGGTGLGCVLEVRAFRSCNGTSSVDGATSVLLDQRGGDLAAGFAADGHSNSAVDFANADSVVQVGETRVLVAVLARPVMV